MFSALHPHQHQTQALRRPLHRLPNRRHNRSSPGSQREHPPRRLHGRSPLQPSRSLCSAISRRALRLPHPRSHFLAMSTQRQYQNRASASLKHQYIAKLHAHSQASPCILCESESCNSLNLRYLRHLCGKSHSLRRLSSIYRCKSAQFLTKRA